MRRVTTSGAVVTLALAIFAFAGGWFSDDPPIDGPGQSMYFQIALDQWRAFGKLTTWLPNMWAGTPVWSIAASVPVVLMLPFTAIFGAENAVKFGCLGGQMLGAVGTFVLARSLWGRTSAAVLAGFFCGLAPIFVSQSFFGVDRASWVLGLIPWIIWALRRSFRGEGRKKGLVAMALAGVLAGIALIQQAEQAYALLLPAVCLLAVYLTAATRRAGGRSALTRGAILLRAGGAAVIAVGITAHWMVPFLSMQDSFVLSPRAIVDYTLIHGIGGDLARDPGSFLRRSPGVGPSVTFPIELPELGSFYLGWFLVVATAVGMALLPKYDEGGEVTAMLLASAVGVWLSTGAIPLASSGPAARRQILPFIFLGAVSGILLGTFLRRLRVRGLALVAGLAAAALLVFLPYITPFLTLRSFLPLLDTIRFPRFYTLAVLGLALGAAFPVAVLEKRLRGREPRLATLTAAALCLALAGVFLVDLHTYRSYYRVSKPERAGAYDRVAERIRSLGTGLRVAAPQWGDPSTVESLVTAGVELSTGWPHPIASKDVFRLTSDVLSAPGGYRDAALALSATAAYAEEDVAKLPGGQMVVANVDLEANPLVLPRVRAYDRVVVVENGDLATELAIALSQRQIGVVSGDDRTATVLGDEARAVLGSQIDCDASNAPALAPETLRGEVAMACAAHDRVRLEEATESDFLEVGRDGAGAIFQSPLDDLRGLAVGMEGGPGVNELTLYEVAPDGNSLGQEVRRTLASGYDPTGMIAFTFEPIPDSAGKRFVFLVGCPRCSDDELPSLTVAKERPRGADVIEGGKIVPKTTAQFMPVYGRTPPAEPSATVIRADQPSPGRWRITTDGPKPSLIVVADAWFPGWTGKVDGRSVDVEKADGAFLGIPVGPGRHEITLEYRRGPAIILGRIITALTIAAVLFLAWPGADNARAMWERGQAAVVRLRRQPATGHERRGQSTSWREPV